MLFRLRKPLPSLHVDQDVCCPGVVAVVPLAVAARQVNPQRSKKRHHATDTVTDVVAGKFTTGAGI